MHVLSQRRFLQLLAASPLALSEAASGKSGPLIDWNAPEQTIDGFGASAAFHQARNLQGFPEAVRQQVLDLLFSPETGAGLSIVRNVVGSGGTWGTPTNGPTPTIEPSEGVWQWAGDEEQVWFMREAAKRGCTRYMSTVWSPPAWMKDNNSVIEGGHVKPDKYRAFAEYLSAYVRGYREHHGIDIYAISPTNEPDLHTHYSSCQWSAEQLHVLVRDHIAPVFARDKVAAKFLLGENSLWSEAPAILALEDPVSAARVDIVASHAYAKVNKGFTPIAQRTGNLVYAQAAGKPVWQTEVSAADNIDNGIRDGLYWAKLLHTHLAENQVSAWFYWWAVFIYKGRGAFIALDTDSKSFKTSKRLFTVGNYARFVRPGFRRVRSLSRPAPGVSLAAFRDPATARAIAVAINENLKPVPLRFPAPAARVQCYRTSESEELLPVEAAQIRRGHVHAHLAAQSVTSFVL